jgi:hypothetical protein
MLPSNNQHTDGCFIPNHAKEYAVKSVIMINVEPRSVIILIIILKRKLLILKIKLLRPIRSIFAKVIVKLIIIARGVNKNTEKNSGLLSTFLKLLYIFKYNSLNFNLWFHQIIEIINKPKEKLHPANLSGKLLSVVSKPKFIEVHNFSKLSCLMVYSVYEKNQRLSHPNDTVIAKRTIHNNTPMIKATTIVNEITFSQRISVLNSTGI